MKNEQPTAATILVVEDNIINQLLLTTNLREAGYIVTVADDGYRALDLLSEHEFDVLLLDLVMPGMDGIELLSHIKADERWRHIPVLVISATDEMATIVQCIEMGAIDYLPKPFDAVLLHARLNTTLANKQMIEMQQRYTQELEIQNKELDAFAHSVAHDLRSPLTGLLTSADLLQRLMAGQWSPKEQKLVERIQSGGRRMAKIIEALLQLADVRHRQPVPAPLDMRHIFAELSSELATLQERYGGTLVLPDEWPSAIGYAPWIQEVWLNYISNGFKYGGSPPHVVVGAEHYNDAVRFWVRDNGKGIAPEQQSHIFNAFTQLDSQRIQGHGLGLSIVERIVHKLDGEVGVESRCDHGACFWFTLPTSLPDCEPIRPVS